MTTTIELPKKRPVQKRVKKDKMSFFVEKLKKMPEIRAPLLHKKYCEKLEQHLYTTVADKIVEEWYPQSE